MLDVGQGTALMLETADGVLVYDTGPRGERFDAGEQVLVPALRAAGWSRLDQLWLSHADADHAGGAAALLASVPAERVYGGEPVPGINLSLCQLGQQLALGQATVTVLHPVAGAGAPADRPVETKAKSARPVKANDLSCVLRIDIGGHRVLLAGDISAEAEAELVSRNPEALAADLLLMPHHGSAGSSSPAFIAAVAPRWVLVSAGYRNPHRHPRPEVVARYQATGAILLNTAELGAVQFDLSKPVLADYAHARAASRLWRRSLPVN